jgi:hypothetical protein
VPGVDVVELHALGPFDVASPQDLPESGDAAGEGASEG